jgi:hypothetical protein
VDSNVVAFFISSSRDIESSVGLLEVLESSIFGVPLEELLPLRVGVPCLHLTGSAVTFDVP